MMETKEGSSWNQRAFSVVQLMVVCEIAHVLQGSPGDTSVSAAAILGQKNCLPIGARMVAVCRIQSLQSFRRIEYDERSLGGS